MNGEQPCRSRTQGISPLRLLLIRLLRGPAFVTDVLIGALFTEQVAHKIICSNMAAFIANGVSVIWNCSAGHPSPSFRVLLAEDFVGAVSMAPRPSIQPTALEEN